MIDASAALTNSTDDRLIVVVGPCASGKTTLVRGLQSRGYRAMVSGQEHSEIPTLWRRTEPDVTIGLNVDLATIRRRRSAGWSESIYRRQQERLRNAFACAAIVLDTAIMGPEQTLQAALELLRGSR
jgi:hypothetical protein